MKMAKFKITHVGLLYIIKLHAYCYQLQRNRRIEKREKQKNRKDK